MRNVTDFAVVACGLSPNAGEVSDSHPAKVHSCGQHSRRESMQSSCAGIAEWIPTRQPLALRPPVNVLFGLPVVLAPTAETERLESHRRPCRNPHRIFFLSASCSFGFRNNNLDTRSVKPRGVYHSSSRRPSTREGEFPDIKPHNHHALRGPNNLGISWDGR